MNSSCEISSPVFFFFSKCGHSVSGWESFSLPSKFKISFIKSVSSISVSALGTASVACQEITGFLVGEKAGKAASKTSKLDSCKSKLGGLGAWFLLLPSSRLQGAPWELHFPHPAEQKFDSSTAAMMTAGAFHHRQVSMPFEEIPLYTKIPISPWSVELR